MKSGPVIIILLFLFLGPNLCYSQNAIIPLSNIVSLRTLFNSIEEQTEYTIFYNNKYLDPEEKVKITKGQTNIFILLKEALGSLNLEYEIREKLIIITPRQSELRIQESNPRISGVVIDEQGTTLPGVTIVIKDTNTGIATDNEGRFSFSSLPGTIIIFSYLGKKSYEYTVKESERSLKITLQDSPLMLDEVVITGVIANTQKKKLGFTVEKLNEEHIQNAPSPNAAMAISGKIPGVRISGSNNAPGSSVNIQLRGTTSIYGGSNPLFIIDGVLSEGNLADINSEDIASIEILKGAASSSLYGSRAANGVINIITKRGNVLSPGSTRIVIRSEFGQSFLPYIPKKTRSINVEVDEGGVDYSNPSPDGIYNNPYPELTDPVGAFFDPGFYATDLVSFSSNSKEGRTSLYGSIQYTKEQGVVKLSDGINRFNFRVNADHRINEKFKVIISSLYSQSLIDNRANGIGDLFYYADPDVDLMSKNEEDGTPYNVDPNKINTRLTNPLYEINNSINYESRNRYLGHYGLIYNPARNIELKAAFGIDNTNSSQFNLLPKGLLQAGISDLTYGSISKGSSNNLAQTIQIDGFYNKKFGDLIIKLKLQYLYESNRYDSHSGSGSHLAIRGLDVTSLEQASENININSYQSAVVAQNFSGVIYFDYKDKYIFDMLLREDGVSLFGADQRWQTFYRISSAWRIVEDCSIPGIQEFKIRASYGVAGLRPTFEAQYEVVGLNNGVITSPISLGNSKLKSSFSKELELGLDARIFNRVNFTFSYSRSNNIDQILEVPVSAVTGFPSQWQNAGKLSSNILEASAGFEVINQENLKWDLNLMWDRINQKVIELNRPGYAIVSGGIFRIEEGVDFGTFYGRIFATSIDQVINQVPEGYTPEEYFVLNNEGFVVRTETIGTVFEEPIQLKDNNGNYIEDVIGSVIPDFNMNISSNLRYRNIGLYCLIGYQQGGETYNHMRRYMIINGVGQQLDQSGKPENAVKSVRYYEKFATWNNDYFVEDATFIKIREMSLTYDFETSFLKTHLGISNISLGLISRNLFTFTNYTGFDPETGVTEEGVDSNILKYDLSSYPNYTTLSGSIKITF